MIHSKGKSADTIKRSVSTSRISDIVSEKKIIRNKTLII